MTHPKSRYRRAMHDLWLTEEGLVWCGCLLMVLAVGLTLWLFLPAVLSIWLSFRLLAIRLDLRDATSENTAYKQGEDHG